MNWLGILIATPIVLFMALAETARSMNNATIMEFYFHKRQKAGVYRSGSVPGVIN
jgi:hypothetical protein